MTKKVLQPSILVVEDEDSISSVIQYNLKREGFNVDSAEDGDSAIKIAKSSKPDLIILDWMLPILSGIEVCKLLRQSPETASIPIIMLSAKGQELDKITGLEYGADDYMTKPFSPVELIARIKAVLRRIRPAFSGKSLKFEDIEMNLDSHIVMRNGQELKLSPIEYKILQVLMENPGRVFSRETLMDKIWGSEIYVGSRTIDVHITRLRKVLLDASLDEFDVIKTVRLAGYTLSGPKRRQLQAAAASTEAE